MRFFTLYFIALFSLLSFSLTSQVENYSRVRIDLKSVDLQTLSSSGLACEHGFHQKGVFFETDLAESEIRMLDDLNADYSIVIPNVAEHYISQAAAPASRAPEDCEETPITSYTTPTNFSLGSMGGYFTYEEMEEHLDSMASKFPNLITVKAPIDAVNLTHDGNPIYWIRISDNANIDEGEPEILYTALHHAREPMSLSQMIFYMWYLLENYNDPSIKTLVDNTEMYFIPCVNPDGYKYNYATNPNGGGLWRKNRRNNNDGTFGVDLNRNYGHFFGYDNTGSSPNTMSSTYRGPSAFSEPETQNVRTLCLNHNFEIALNYHSYGNYLINPFGYSDQLTPDSTLFRAYTSYLTSENGYTAGTGTETVGYTVNGDSDDWMYGEQTTKNKIYSMTPEAGPGQYGFYPPSAAIIDICKENMFQNLGVPRLLLNRGTINDVSPLFTSILNNQANFELQRIGIANGSFTVGINPLNNVASSGSPKSFSNLTAFDTLFDSIAITLDPGIVAGESFSYVLELDNGTELFQDTITRYYGLISTPFVDAFDNLSNWSNLATNDSDWGLTSQTFYSPNTSVASSPFGNYGPNEENELILSSPLDLSNASLAYLSFWAKWEIEDNYDYVQVMASSNNTVFTPLCGLYTNIGTADQAEDDPLYDGSQSDWVNERISLADYLGQSEVWIKFRFVSDGFASGDGFYFDDLQLEINDVGTALKTIDNSISIGDAIPNPSSGSVYLPYSFNNQRVRHPHLIVFNALGQEVYNRHLQSQSNGLTISTESWAEGIYYYMIKTSDHKQSPTKKLVVLK